jgi:hypothetical protein
MALEDYDAFFREYPKRLAEETERPSARAPFSLPPSTRPRTWSAHPANKSRTPASRWREHSPTTSQDLANHPSAHGRRVFRHALLQARLQPGHQRPALLGPRAGDHHGNTPAARRNSLRSGPMDGLRPTAKSHPRRALVTRPRCSPNQPSSDEVCERRCRARRAGAECLGRGQIVDRFQRERMYRNPGVLVRPPCPRAPATTAYSPVRVNNLAPEPGPRQGRPLF